MNNQLIFLIYLFAKKNNIPLDKDEAKTQLLSHPYYPSISCITDLFNHFNIDNYALRVETNLETYSQIPECFMAQVDEGGSKQLVVVSKSKNGVSLIYDENISKNISIDEFLKLWTGVLFVIEKPDTQINSTLKSEKKVKKIIYALALVVLVSLFIQAKPSFFEFIYMGLSCVGIYVSYLIVMHELGFHSKIVDKICSGESKNTNCDAVLNSTGSTVLNLVKLSDVGFIYFITLALTVFIITSNNLQTSAVIFVVSTLAIPFTFYSLYYQLKIIKSWCPLCLTTIGVLWLQFVALFESKDFIIFPYVIDFSYVIFLASLLTTASLWILIKPLLKKEQKFKKLEIDHIKFKRNFKLFNASLKMSPVLDTEIPSTTEIIFGDKNPDALLQIIVITNPMCGYCKESHRLIEKILINKMKHVQVIIRFNVQVENEKALGTRIAAKILEIYHTTNEENCLTALSDIYGNIEANSWLEKWGQNFSPEYFFTLKSEKEWCSNNSINFTPEILINGLPYPKEYNKIDLQYFVDELIEEQEIYEKTQMNFS